LGTVLYASPHPDSDHASGSKLAPHASRTETSPSRLVSRGIQGEIITYSACELDNFILINGETFLKSDGEDCSRLKLAQQLQVLVHQSINLVTPESFARILHC